MVSKIQSHTRKNNSTVHSVTIPITTIEESGFKKGTEVEFQVDKDKRIIITEVK